jgi:hypothetical protein
VSSVIGVLNGFDRLLFRGTLRRIASASGLSSFLSYTGVLLKDFADHSMELTARVKSASLAVAEKASRPVQYLVDPSVRKEDLAREIAERDKIDSGLVCVFTAVEPCWSFEIHRNRAGKKLELLCRQRRCLHLYHCMIHPQWGRMHIRIQSWFPSAMGPYPIEPYWSVQQSEWATDVMFKSPKELATLYPRLIRQGTETMGSRDVLRFETTINRTEQFKVYRGTEENPEKLEWRRLRKGIADLHRRAQVSQACNDRYTKAMAAVEQTTPLKYLAQPPCVAVKKKGRRARALNPLATGDAALLAAVVRGEFAINGLRNRDIRALLHPNQPADKTKIDKALARRRSAAVGRKLAMLRVHGLIRKVPRTHRYQVTDKGRLTITALLAAARANATGLAKAA